MFEVGKKQVVEGLELGIQSMVVGERAVLLCGASYAFGDDTESEFDGPGSRSGHRSSFIPPHCTIIYDVDVLKTWKNRHKTYMITVLVVLVLAILVKLSLDE